MDKAKALLGKYAFNDIYARDRKVDYEFCKKYLVYCPECLQWVHYREETKVPHFAHYDVPDKRCSNRTHTSSYTTTVVRTNNKNQTLTDILGKFESIFVDSNFDPEVVKRYSDETINKYLNWFKLDSTRGKFLNNCHKTEEYFVNLLLEILSKDMNELVLVKLILNAIYYSEKNTDKVGKRNLDLVEKQIFSLISIATKNILLNSSFVSSTKKRENKKDLNKVEAGWYILRVQHKKEWEIISKIRDYRKRLHIQNNLSKTVIKFSTYLSIIKDIRPYEEGLGIIYIRIDELTLVEFKELEKVLKEEIEGIYKLLPKKFDPPETI